MDLFDFETILVLKLFELTKCKPDVIFVLISLFVDFHCCSNNNINILPVSLSVTRMAKEWNLRIRQIRTMKEVQTNFHERKWPAYSAVVSTVFGSDAVSNSTHVCRKVVAATATKFMCRIFYPKECSEQMFSLESRIEG